MEHIIKIGALIIRDKKLLLVRKKGFSEYTLPGGKPERNEKEEDTIKRELKEELNVDVSNMQLYREYETEKAAHDKASLTLKTYLVGIVGALKISEKEEMEEFRWIGRDYKLINLPTLLKEKIFPDLKKDGFI